MMRRRWIPAATAALATVTVLTACGSDSSGGSATVPADADVVIKAEDGLVWDASSYSATATDGKVLIAAQNDSGLAHNLYVVAADGTQASSFIDLPNRGSKGAKDFSLAAGTYSVICKVPGHSNMKATLTVS